MQILKRRVRPLVVNWILLLAAAGLLYWVERELPALRDILAPLYIALGLGILYTGYRWLRKRVNNRRDQRDRRHGDRRSDKDDQFFAGEG